MFSNLMFLSGCQIICPCGRWILLHSRKCMHIKRHGTYAQWPISRGV